MIELHNVKIYFCRLLYTTVEIFQNHNILASREPLICYVHSKARTSFKAFEESNWEKAAAAEGGAAPCVEAEQFVVSSNTLIKLYKIIWYVVSLFHSFDGKIKE